MRKSLAALGFAAVYLPVLLLFGVILATDTEVVEESATGVRTAVTRDVSWAVVALASVAAVLAWWWSGRAVRPIDRVRAVAEEIGATDLGRRIGMTGGPAEVRALAASFDAMLDRLASAADAQRLLVEETSHALRTPLSVLATGTEVLLAHPRPTVEVYREGLERTRRAAERLRTTVEELLVDARGRARVLDRRPVDVVAIVLETGVPTTGAPSAVCPVDEPTVRRAVDNLLDNANRYAGGAEVAVEVTDTHVVVVVTDHGPGIPPDQAAHVFDRFWRGSDLPGAGLGLAIARQVALAHGGDLVVRSPGPSGDGCEFRLSLHR